MVLALWAVIPKDVVQDDGNSSGSDQPFLTLDPILHFAEAQALPLGKAEPESCWQPGTSASALFRPHH